MAEFRRIYYRVIVQEVYWVLCFLKNINLDFLFSYLKLLSNNRNDFENNWLIMALWLRLLPPPLSSTRCTFHYSIDVSIFSESASKIFRAGGRLGKSLAAKMASQIFGNRLLSIKKKKNYLCCSRDNFIDTWLFLIF